MSITSQNAQDQFSRGSVVHYQPSHDNLSVSPNTCNEKPQSSSASPFMNQIQRMDMFGSHFKPGTQAFDELARPACGESLAARPGLSKEISEYTMQPISSIEDPQSTSFLQQSSSMAFTANSRPDT